MVEGGVLVGILGEFGYPVRELLLLEICMYRLFYGRGERRPNGAEAAITSQGWTLDEELLDDRMTASPPFSRALLDGRYTRNISLFLI